MTGTGHCPNGSIIRKLELLLVPLELSQSRNDTSQQARPFWQLKADELHLPVGAVLMGNAYLKSTHSFGDSEQFQTTNTQGDFHQSSIAARI
jgi:hypothetical protein